MRKIFISYASEERAFAERVRNALVSWGGYEPWMDQHEIAPADSWIDDIDQALRSAEIVIGLASSVSIKKPNVRREWNWTLDAPRPLILVRLDEYQNSERSHRIVELQWIDYATDEATGFARLRGALEGKPPGDLAASSPAQKSKGKGDTASINRERMLQRVQTYWIEGVLRQAVNESNRFNIGYGLAPDAVVQNVDYSDCVLPANSDFGKLFRHVSAEMLILGAPGSGKTILLLQLAEFLLAAAARDEGGRIPVVLNLSSWSPRYSTLAEWIVQEAYASYQVPRKTIQRWLEENQLTLLLDGLDEVLLENRDACVEAINGFREVHRGIEIAVCSRLADYNLLKSKLALRMAILIQPLDDAQVSAVISRPDMAGLKAVWEREPWLHDMAYTPFLLNVMSCAYAGREEPSLRLPTGQSGEEARRDHLLDTYITRRLADTRDRRTDSAQKIRNQLSWLAARMQERGQSVFHMEDLQMDWLAGLVDQYAYGYVSRLFFAAVILAFNIPWVVKDCLDPRRFDSTPLFYFTVLLQTVFLAWMTSCILVWNKKPSANKHPRGLATLFATSLVAVLPVAGPYEILAAMGNHEKYLIPVLVAWPCTFFAVAFAAKSSLSPLKLHLFSGFTLGLFMGILVASVAMKNHLGAWALGPVLGAFQILSSWAGAAYSDHIGTTEKISWQWPFGNSSAGTGTGIKQLWTRGGVLLTLALVGILVAFPSVLCVSIIGIPTSFIVVGLVAGFKRESVIQKRTSPGQGINRSLRNGILGAISSGIFAFAAVYGIELLFDPRASQSSLAYFWPPIILGSLIAALGATVGGVDVPVKHYTLRCILAVTGQCPLFLRRFLDGCMKSLLLRRVGGGYIFIHRYLLEYFAKSYRGPASRPVAES